MQQFSNAFHSKMDHPQFQPIPIRAYHPGHTRRHIEGDRKPQSTHIYTAFAASLRDAQRLEEEVSEPSHESRFQDMCEVCKVQHVICLPAISRVILVRERPEISSNRQVFHHLLRVIATRPLLAGSIYRLNLLDRWRISKMAWRRGQLTRQLQHAEVGQLSWPDV
jgi:hypothetical protein